MPSRASTDGSAGRIVLVDDTAESRCDITEPLRREGYTTHIAGDNAEAIKLAEDRDIDAILVRLDRFSQAGMKATRTLRADPTTQHIPVLAFAAPTALQRRFYVLEASTDNALWKTIEQAEFLRRVDNLVALKQANDSIRRRNDQLTEAMVRRAAKLEQREAAYRSMLETAPDIVMLLDLHGTIQFVSRTLNGGSPEDFRGRSVFDAIGHDHALRGVMTTALENPGVHSCELRFEPPGLPTHSFSTRVKLIDMPDGEKRFLIFATDTTASRQTEEALHETKGQLAGRLAELESAYETLRQETKAREAAQTTLLQAQKLQAVGGLAAGIAHEINSPGQFAINNMQFIQAAGQQIEKAFAAFEDFVNTATAAGEHAEAEADLATRLAALKLPFIRKELPVSIEHGLEGMDRIGSIVKAMKVFAHPGSAHKQPADINEGIQSTVTIARNEWKYVADIELELDPSLPLVPCLLGEVNQVVLNLIVNSAHAIAEAHEAGGPKGKITICTSHDIESARITVRDDGAGIEPHLVERIFEPFFTTKTVGQGTGQGLALAHAVIHGKHGGTISCLSEVGGGTEFTVRLPLNVGLHDNQQSESPEITTETGAAA